MNGNFCTHLQNTPLPSHFMKVEDSVGTLINQIHVMKILGQQYYNERLSPEENIVNAINNGTFPNGEDILLQNMTFSIGSQLLTFPPNVTLHQCNINSGFAYFTNGNLSANGPDSAVFAGGSEANAYAIKEGSRAFATADGANACATAPNAIAIATTPGAHTHISNGGDEVPFDQLEYFLNRLVDTVSQGDASMHYGLARLLLNNTFPMHETTEVAMQALLAASQLGHAQASYDLGKLFLINSHEQESRVELASDFFTLATAQGHPKAPFELGELFRPYFYQIIGQGTGYGQAYQLYKEAHMRGDTRAAERINEYNSNDFNFDRILFGIK